jgi:hypothetical protein
MCFFCVKGLTDGITHRPLKGAKVIVEYACGTLVTTNKCTDVRVSLGLSSGKYCRMFYRKQLTTELSAKEDNRSAEPLLWDVRSARSLFAKSAGKRGTINMHNFT